MTRARRHIDYTKLRWCFGNTPKLYECMHVSSTVMNHYIRLAISLPNPDEQPRAATSSHEQQQSSSRAAEQQQQSNSRASEQQYSIPKTKLLVWLWSWLRLWYR